MKSLIAESQAEDEENCSSAHMPLAAMNIEQLVNTSKTSTQVKVIIVNPNGRENQTNQFHEITKTLIVNLTQKKMESSCKCNVQTPILKSRIAPLKRCISDEFKKSCADGLQSGVLTVVSN